MIQPLDIQSDEKELEDISADTLRVASETKAKKVAWIKKNK